MARVFPSSSSMRPHERTRLWLCQEVAFFAQPANLTAKTPRLLARSAVLGPSARRPSSRSACTAQLRTACPDGTNSGASSSGVRPACTN